MPPTQYDRLKTIQDAQKGFSATSKLLLKKRRDKPVS